LGRTALRENIALCALSGPSTAVGLLVPLYLTHLGYPVAFVGAILALTSVATLLSRLPAARLYRPDRSKPLLLITLTLGASSFAVMPLMVGNMVVFAAVLAMNRAFFGLATTFFLARYLDMIAGNDDRRRAMGWYGGTQAAGYTSANALVGIIADLLGYQAAFLYGTVFSAIAIAFLIGAPELPASASGAAVGRRGGHGFRGLWGHVDDPGLWSALNVVSWNNLFHLLLTSFFPVFATGVGMGPSQIGLTRAVYSGVNAVGRPIAGIAIERLSLHRSIMAGLGVQALLLFCVPFVIDAFPILLALFVVAATGRCIVVVANSVQLVEDVDETRVSRGVATSAYNLASDVTHTLGPLGTGALAAAIGIGPMFSAVALGAAGLYLLGQAGVARLHRARVASPSAAGGPLPALAEDG